MIDPHRPSYPLPPMDEMPDEGDWSAAVRDWPAGMTVTFGWPRTAWEAYVDARRQWAEAIGRPYPAERHAVWPR